MNKEDVKWILNKNFSSPPRDRKKVRTAVPGVFWYQGSEWFEIDDALYKSDEKAAGHLLQLDEEEDSPSQLRKVVEDLQGEIHSLRGREAELQLLQKLNLSQLSISLRHLVELRLQELLSLDADPLGIGGRNFLIDAQKAEIRKLNS